MTDTTSMQPADAKPSIREAWDRIAPAFDEFMTPQSVRFGEEVLRRADIGPGVKFLDVAAGSGALSIPAARLGAEVLATDISPVMIECLTARAHSEGMSNLEARVMDGCALDLPDGVFDVVASQHGVSLFPDVLAGLAELRRVTKPGGQAIVVAFGRLQKAEFIGFFMGAIRAAVPQAPALPVDPPPLPFQLADPEVFRGKLSEAGFAEVAVETVSWDMQIESAASLWKTAASSNPIGAGMAAGLTDDQRTDALQVLTGMLRERAAGRPVAELKTEINIGTARKL
ncbi:class I SAM-dependent methyltransferase [Arthrobacter crystallopoietes]|uniref:class I SAM-dependent methyltransferase n=1 Tax=Crystallibacter crystallopoietes TaxID=37928 RepID=UPI001ABDC845|nr:methyltransferase domain-containing protein [Arthrobacter crystallopoietes]QTG79453.1 methyltransferase domain-containing protein [Arthrobacter crystallopoietes]